MDMNTKCGNMENVWSVFNIRCAYSLNSFQVLLNVHIIHFDYYNFF